MSLETIKPGIIRDDLFTNKIFKFNNEYTDERSKLHRHIIYVKVSNISNYEPLTAVLVGGGSGAGKSTIIEQYYLKDANGALMNPPNFVHIDADDIKTYIDEYKKYQESIETAYYAAFYVHEESTDIVNALIDECIAKRLSFIYDGTMKWQEQYDKLIPQLKENGYKVSGIYVDVDVDVALQRTKARGKKEKRIVPENIVKEANRNSAITFSHLESSFDDVMMFNNTEKRVEDEPVPLFYERDMVATNSFEGHVIIQKFFDVFKEKSQLPYIE